MMEFTTTILTRLPRAIREDGGEDVISSMAEHQVQCFMGFLKPSVENSPTAGSIAAMAMIHAGFIGFVRVMEGLQLDTNSVEDLITRFSKELNYLTYKEMDNAGHDPE